jgi:hypothetical protein
MDLPGSVGSSRDGGGGYEASDRPQRQYDQSTT